MTSRDNQASYYDLELPDGTRTEVWSVLRAVLTPEEALGYIKGCIATRIMRDGKKPDVDRLREAEKVGIEAGMLREAMEAYLATPVSVAAVTGEDEPMTAAEAARLNLDGWAVSREHLDALAEEKKRMDAEQRQAAVDMADPMETAICLPTEESFVDRDEAVTRELAEVINRHSLENESDTPDFLLAGFAREVLASFARVTRGREKWYSDPAARIAELEQALRNVEDALPKGAGLRDDYGRIHEHVANVVADLSIARNRIAELKRELREARHEASRERELTTEKVDMVRDLGSELVGARRELTKVFKRHDKESQVLKHAVATEHAALLRAQSDLAALRKTLETERQAAVATAEELERVRKELADERGWNDLRREMYERLGRALDPFRQKRYSGEPARDDATEVEAICRELAALRDRYRPRRQSEEPAPRDEVVHVWDTRVNRWMTWPGERVPDDATWTHQPPAPGEGEA